MTQRKMILTFALCFSTLSLQARAQSPNPGPAKILRAADMNSHLWSQLKSGELQDVTVAFQQGDVLPVTFQAQGDLLTTTQVNVSYVTVKRSFWVRVNSDNQVLLSLDGSTYKPFNEVLSGSLSASASGPDQGGLANAINVVFSATLK